MELRQYQTDCVQALWRCLRENRRARPLLVCPTGSGKSVIVAEIIRQIRLKRPEWRVLVLTHRKEIVKQNAETYQRITGEAVGVVSAGLGLKIVRPVTFANIQSIYKLKMPWEVVIIDEAHLISGKPESMYSKFLAEQNSFITLGLTATPYRMDHGFLVGPGTLFTDIAYEISITGLIENGFLAPLYSVKREEIDTSQVMMRGNDFAQEALEQAAMEGVSKQIKDVLERTKDKKHVLVFCSGVKHALQVATELGGECVHGGLAAFERDGRIRRFTEGTNKYLTNCDILTTGFDFPAIDCVVLLRPTLSTGLYVQMVGRGSRIAPGKSDCLILDYGGNIRRHGPIDQIHVDFKEKTAPEFSIPPLKTCEHCGCVVHISVMICPACGEAFPKGSDKHKEMVPETAPIISNKTNGVEVLNVTYKVHYKPGGLPSFRTDYELETGESLSEFWCFNHDGYAQQKACHLWGRFGGDAPPPRSSEEAERRARELKKPTRVRVQKDGKYLRLTHVLEWYTSSTQEDDLSLPNL